MKAYFKVLPAVFAITFIVTSNGYSQSGVTIVGPPNGTRITDCETGQLVGGGYTAAIFWGAAGVTDRNQFTQAGATMPIVNGMLFGGSRTIAAPQMSTVGLFAAAWETSAGTTYQQASQVVGAKVGASPILQVVLNDSMVRFPDFEVCPVPEPSTWALLVLGTGLAIVAGRRVRRS